LSTQTVILKAALSVEFWASFLDAQSSKEIFDNRIVNQ